VSKGSSGFSVHCFWIESFCERGRQRVSDAALGSNDTQHVIEIENGAWDEDYDVIVTSELPNSRPQAHHGRQELLFDPGQMTSWMASCNQIPFSLKSPDDRYMDVIAPAPTTAIIKSHDVFWRLDGSAPWDFDPTNPSCSIQIDLT